MELVGSFLPLEANPGEGDATALPVGPQRQGTLIPAVLALIFPEHTDTPARGAGMLYSHHSCSATRNNSQLLPKGIFSCIIYLNTCLRLQGREQSLSSGRREGGRSSTGRSGPFSLEDSRAVTQVRWSKTRAMPRKRMAWLG